MTPDATPPRRIHVSAAVITDADGRLLVVRKAGTTAFMQPGGKPEPDETPAETLARELAEEVGLHVDAEHHAHALHAPYWWLNCAFGETSRVSKAWHKVLVWDIMRKPWLTRTAESALNPVLGKSLVVYATKPVGGAARAAA